MKNIIAGIDGSSKSLAVCDAATWASKQVAGPVTFLHTIERAMLPVTDDLSGAIGLGSQEILLQELVKLDEERGKLALEQGKQLLEKIKMRALEQGANEVHVKQRHGDIIDSFIDLEEDSRLYVLGRSGEDNENKEKAIGSHIDAAVRHLNTSLLITTAGQFMPPKSFMLAYDGRKTAQKALERAIESDLLNSLECHLVMVGNNKAAKKEKLDEAEALLKANGFTVHAEFLDGNIYSELAAYKQRVSPGLLVMGAYGGSRIRQFFVGSNTTKMIAEAKIPLLVVK